MMLSTSQRLIIFKVLRTSGLIKELVLKEFVLSSFIKLDVCKTLNKTQTRLTFKLLYKFTFMLQKLTIT